jgi:hypothetical protein
MTDDAAIAAELRRAIALLAELDDAAATHAAETIARCLAGEDFDSAAGFAPGWRRELQQAARDAALQALLALHPELDAQPLAQRIVARVERAARMRGIRPDGEAGHYHDLARAEVHRAARTWRGLIGEARGKPSIAIATTSSDLPLKPEAS